MSTTSGPLEQIKRSEQGFTLFEIAVSIAILGTAFATILSLQTSILNAYSREESLFRASLYAQYLMAVIEADAEETLSSQSGDLKGRLTDVGYFDDSLAKPDKELEGWEYELKVEPIVIPGREDEEAPMERIDVIISWNESDDSNFILTYYRVIKSKKDSAIP